MTDWEIAVEHFPDLSEINSRLENCSSSLALDYRSMILKTKRYKWRHKLAQQIEHRYMEATFGDDVFIQHFARQLIENRHIAAKEELARRMKVLGNDVDAGSVIARIQASFPEICRPSSRQLVDGIARRLSDTEYVADAVALIKSLGGVRGRKSGQIMVIVLGEAGVFEDEYEMTQWVVKNIAPRVMLQVSNR
jgi:hypothetical protein